MSYVEGTRGQEIERLCNKADEAFANEEFEKSIKLNERAWDLLPKDKYSYDESYLIVWSILSISIKIKNIEKMNQWVEKIFHADPERPDTGEREMWAGRVAFESENYEEARKYLKIAYDKSKGRLFSEDDKKYKDFLLKEK